MVIRVKYVTDILDLKNQNKKQPKKPTGKINI